MITCNRACSELIIGGANFRINYQFKYFVFLIFVQLSIVTQNTLTLLCKEMFVSFNFRVMLFNTKYTNISTIMIRKLPAIR